MLKNVQIDKKSMFNEYFMNLEIFIDMKLPLKKK